MKMLKNVMLAVMLSVALVGCQVGGMTQINAAQYVQGLLNQTYKGTWDAVYLDLTGQTEAEAQRGYDNTLKQEYARFCYQFDIRDSYLTDESRDGVMELLEDLSARANYTVRTATKMDSTRYAVEVEVRSMDLLVQVRTDAMSDYTKKFEESYNDINLTEMTALEREEFWETYESEWADGIVEICQTKLRGVGYSDAVKMLVIVAPDSNKMYGMSNHDFANLATLIMPY